MNKLIIRALLVVTAFIITTAPCLADATKGKPEKIRFAYQPVHTLLVVANEQGWFKEEFEKDGITFEADKFIAGPPIIEAFAGERIDFGLTGDQPALLARANNIDIKAIGVPLSGPKSLALVVPTGSKITRIKDLKGKKVGVTVGSVAHHLLYLYLKKNGLKPADVQVVNLLPPDIKTSIEQKVIDAAITWDPWVSIMEDEKTGRQIADATGLKLNANVILVSGKFAAAYPDLVKRVLKVLVKSEKWIKKNPEEAITISAKATGVKREIQAKVFAKYNYDIRLTPAVIKSFEETASFLRESNVLRKDVDVKSLVDTSYLKAIGAQK
jgi:sulfonate transport system substrate-binding protein